MSDLEWLEKLCDPDRASIAAPMNTGSASHPYVITTNGKILVAVQGSSTEFGTMPDNIFNSYIKSWISLPIESFKPLYLTPISFLKLKEWCGKPNWPTGAPCYACSGKGETHCDRCRGTGTGGEVACRDCGETHDCCCRYCDEGMVQCKPCGGTGKENGLTPSRYGEIASVPVNREELARAFEHLSADTVVCAQTGKSELIIIGPDWRVVYAPLGRVEGKTDCAFQVDPPSPSIQVPG